MIDLFKVKELSEEETEFLKYVNPFWESSLNKKIKKLNRWLLKFSSNNDSFKLPLFYRHYDLINISKSLNNYRMFLSKKYELIKLSMRTLRKFNPFVHDFANCQGILSGIIAIIEYYQYILNNDISNKKDFSIELINNKIESYFINFKSKILSSFNQEQYIVDTLNTFLKPKKNITDTNNIVSLIFKYIRVMFKKKKITEDKFIAFSLDTIKYISYVNSISFIYEKFNNNIY